MNAEDGIFQVKLWLHANDNADGPQRKQPIGTNLAQESEIFRPEQILSDRKWIAHLVIVLLTFFK